MHSFVQMIEGETAESKVEAIVDVMDLFRNTADRKASSALARVVCDEKQDRDIRWLAYVALLDIHSRLLLDWPLPPESGFRVPEDFDLSFVRQFLP